MKIVWLIVAFVSAAFDGLATAELPGPPDTVHFADLTVEQAGNLLDSVDDKVLEAELVSEAVKSGRMDLIEVCFEHDHGRFTLPAIAGRLHDETFCDAVAVMMLKSESAYWRPDIGRYFGGLSMQNYLVEPITSAIKRRLPDTPLGNDLVTTRDARYKTAVKLEAAIHGSPEDAIRPQRRPPVSEQGNLFEFQASTPNQVRPPLELKNEGEAAELKGFPWVTVTAILLVALSIGRWVWVRRIAARSIREISQRRRNERR